MMGLNRNAYTLLELLLALALSVMVISAVATAMRLNIVMLDKQRVRIEQTQIARSVLQVIANDLRAAVQYKPADVTGLQEVMSSPLSPEALAGLDTGSLDTGGLDTGSLDTGGLDTGGLDTGGLDTGGLDTGGLGSGGTDPGGFSGDSAGSGGAEGAAQPTVDTSSIASGSQQPVHPGLFGGSDQISVDVSRLPRIDQYNPQVVGEGVVALPSDVKTVAYYVQQGNQQEAISFDWKSDDQLGGLFRRNIDRAAANYAYSAGNNLQTVSQVELLATEIAELQFRYWDGQDWLSEWDSLNQGGFPTAVEVTIVVDPRRVEVHTQTEYQYNGYDPDSMLLHRSVVYLPVAEILSEEEQALMTNPQPSAETSDASGSAGESEGGER